MATGYREEEELTNQPLYELALQRAGDRPTYAGTHEAKLSELFDRIQNREKFSYDINADPLYGMYKDKYTTLGKLAMRDTMGQAAALTGGYDSTYGQQVGQQTYDAYLQSLSDVIPQLYGMAYDQYQDEGDKLMDLYGLVGQQRDAEYGMYRDELGDWENMFQSILNNERYEREFATEREQEEYNRNLTAEAIARQMEQQEYERRMYAEEVARQLEAQEYNRRQQEDETLYKRRIYDEETARAQQQQMYTNLSALIKASGYTPTDAELAAAGMTREAANALAAEYNRNIAFMNSELSMRYANSGGSSGGGGSSRVVSSGGGGGSYGGSYGGGGGGVIVSDQGNATVIDPYYNSVYDAAVQAAKVAGANRGSTTNTGTLPIIQAVREDNTLSAQQKKNIQEAVVVNANAGVNRSALGSPTGNYTTPSGQTVTRNMGGTDTGSQTVIQMALNKLKNLFK